MLKITGNIPPFGYLTKSNSLPKMNISTKPYGQDQVCFTSNRAEGIEEKKDKGIATSYTKFIFLGAPASGKGTQTTKLAKELNIPHIEMGGMLRAARKEGTELGKVAASYMDAGKLAPNEIVIGIVKERLSRPDCKDGFILDGFPRSIEQAEALDKIMEDIDKDAKILVVNIDTPQDILIDRIVTRRSCEDCGETYNIKSKPSKEEGICDDCGGKLIQRKDDNAETAENRLETFKIKTQPLIDYYDKKGNLVNIDGSKDINDVYEDIKQVIQ